IYPYNLRLCLKTCVIKPVFQIRLGLSETRVGTSQETYRPNFPDQAGRINHSRCGGLINERIPLTRYRLFTNDTRNVTVGLIAGLNINMSVAVPNSTTQTIKNRPSPPRHDPTVQDS